MDGNSQLAHLLARGACANELLNLLSHIEPWDGLRSVVVRLTRALSQLRQRFLDRKMSHPAVMMLTNYFIFVVWYLEFLQCIELLVGYSYYW